MQSKAATVDEYIQGLPPERQEVIKKLRATIKKHLPKGFKEEMSYGMIGYVVPFSTYPKGYHCDAKLPLPFINLGSQKNHISLHNLGIYGNEKLADWFTEEYARLNIGKLDMGKGCIRFKKIDSIPYELIGQLVSKISVQDWIKLYEEKIRK